MKVKDIIDKITYKNTIIRVNVKDDYFEYLKKDCEFFSNTILNLDVKEILPLERRLEIYTF